MDLRPDTIEGRRYAVISDDAGAVRTDRDGDGSDRR